MTVRFKRKTRWYFWLVLALAPLGLEVGVQAEPSARDQVTYDTLFRDKLMAVQRSRSRSDDVELIGQMFESAQSIPDDPGVRQLIYRGIVSLAASVDEYASVMRAVEKLREDDPDDPALDPAGLLEMFERGFRIKRDQERIEVGGFYLDLLIDQAESATREGDTEAAADGYREALRVAEAIGSPRVREIEDSVERLARTELINERLIQLERAVQINPRNAKAARQLIVLLLIEKDAPERALAFVDQADEPDLADIVSFAAVGVDAVSPPQALRLGDWYYAHAQTADGGQAFDLFSRAAAYYDRMLEHYGHEDALRQRVVTMRQMAGDELDKLRAEHIGDQAGQWVDLIALFEPRRHRLGRNVDTRNGKLYSARTDFVLPHAPTDGYDLRLRLEFVDGERGLVLSLPIGPHRFFDLHYNWDLEEGIGLAEVVSNNDQEVLFRQGREYQLDIEVRPGDELNAIRVLVDGGVVAEWEGDRGRLTTKKKFLYTQETGRAIRVNCGGQFIFSQVQVLEVSQ
ncbi:MAG: hypothetical protein AAGC44_06425 [Planctomycetota bacterium]